jgi:hypothetical protein
MQARTEDIDALENGGAGLQCSCPLHSSSMGPRDVTGQQPVTPSVFAYSMYIHLRSELLLHKSPRCHFSRCRAPFCRGPRKNPSYTAVPLPRLQEHARCLHSHYRRTIHHTCTTLVISN